MVNERPVPQGIRIEKVDHPDQEVDMDRAAYTGRQLDRWECWNPRNTEKEKDD